MSDAAGARRRSSLRSASPPPARVERSPRGASPAPAKPPKAAKGKAAKPTGLWHSTAGGAPTFRGKTALQRFASAAGLISLIVFTPPVAIVTVHVLIHNKGSVAGFVDDARKAGVFTHLLAILPPVDFTGRAARLLATFASFEALLLMFMPGKRFVGTVTAAGNRPVYKANGFQCFVATFVAYFVALRFELFSPLEVYTLFPQMITLLSVFAFFFVWVLYFKGWYAPSSSDSGSSGSLITDYYWGMELYPRFFGGQLDVKTFTNCRFGMMGWAVLVVTFALAQKQLHGSISDSMAVCSALMLGYVAKFFAWETGYWNSMDIMHDRAGYMICWGCLTWVPAIYTSPGLYLVAHPWDIGMLGSAALLAAGAASVYINYASDAQRQAVRAADGKAMVWGQKAEVIVAPYVTARGEAKSSLLLCSGWWGVARHFHYVPELAAALLWTLPCGLSHALPYFYFVFLTLLLVDRANRDDKRCASKYTSSWGEYTKKVPYKMIPYVY